MKTGKIIILAGLLAGLLTGCSQTPEGAKADLEKMKKNGQIDEVSADNFFRCAQLGNRDAINLYLESGMSVDARNAQGKTPLMGAVGADSNSPWFNRNEGIVRFLIEKGADVNAVDNQGQSVFQIGKNLTRFQIVRVLAEAGAKEYPNGIPTPTPAPGTY